MTTTPTATHDATTTETGTGPATDADDQGRDQRLRGFVQAVRTDLARQLSDPTPAYAALGATEAIAERVRDAARHGASLAARARRPDSGLDASHLPRLAVSRALTLAGHVEATYAGMATRGRDVAERVRDGRQATELLRLAVLGVSRVMPTSGRGTDAATTTVVPGETVEAGPAPTGGEPAAATPSAGTAAEAAAPPAAPSPEADTTPDTVTEAGPTPDATDATDTAGTPSPEAGPAPDAPDTADASTAETAR